MSETAVRQTPADCVARLLQREGPAGLQRLTGCFALIAIDTADCRLLATRDRSGGRTLYFNASKGQITLATRPAWIMHIARLPFRESGHYLAAHFALQSAPPAGSTAFEDVQELMPGELLQFENDTLSLSPQPLSLEADPALYADPVASFRELLTNAVHTALPDSGDVAVMLSGGLDSGPMAMLADSKLAQSNQALKPVSWSLNAFPEADEAQWILHYDQALRSAPIITDLSDRLPFGDLDTAYSSENLPSYNAFNALIEHCYQESAEQGCRVILNAAVGDRIYPAPRLLLIDLLRRRRWRALGQELRGLIRREGLSGFPRDAAVRYGLGRWVPGRQREGTRRAWLTPLAQSIQAEEEPSTQLVCHTYPDYAQQLFGPAMAFGQAHTNEHAQRFGIDRRDPYQNEALLRFMLHLPVRSTWQDGWDKAIMREAMRGLIPEPIRHKRRTGLLHALFRSGLRAYRQDVRELLLDQNESWQQYVQKTAVEEALSGKPGAPDALIALCVGYLRWLQHWQGRIR
ncbi:MAG: asparagine synthase-related protein [Pseudomonadota bacterium]